MKRLLVTGAAGQIGSELVPALRERYGEDRVVASDIRDAGELVVQGGPFVQVDCMDAGALGEVVRRQEVGTVYHLAALLSATAEKNPQKAYAVNLGALFNVLEVARECGCAVFTPSSIAVFGPAAPREATPQDAVQRPTTMYGVTKVAGELLCDYYFQRYGVDTRGVRYPGLISHVTAPGGGTTDYAVEIFYHALESGRYTCFLAADTQLDMMYMADAVRAAIELMQADGSRLRHRNAYNITALQVTPAQLASAIRRHLPDFRIMYQPDPVRQRIADSWPRRLDDRSAREEWGWKPEYDLESMTSEMLERLAAKLGRPLPALIQPS